MTQECDSSSELEAQEMLSTLNFNHNEWSLRNNEFFSVKNNEASDDVYEIYFIDHNTYWRKLHMFSANLNHFYFKLCKPQTYCEKMCKTIFYI